VTVAMGLNKGPRNGDANLIEPETSFRASRKYLALEVLASWNPAWEICETDGAATALVVLLAGAVEDTGLTRVAAPISTTLG
jgi:hypothetical protein